MADPTSRIPNALRVTTFLVFLLVVWGGVVRLSGSGLAIPDWPLDQGNVVPRSETRVLIEYGHRVLAGLVTLFTLGTAIAVYRSRSFRPRLGYTMAAALVTLMLQVFMGARVVLDELPVDRVVAHLLLAFLFFAFLVHMTLVAGEISRGEPEAGKSRRPGLLVWGRAATLSVYAQAGLGAWVSSSGASLACPDFPTCHGQWIPRLEGLVGIQFAHRLGALVVFVLVGAFAHLAARAKIGRSVSRWARLATVLLFLQILLGIANILLRVPLHVSATHLAVALLLFGSLFAASHEIRRA
jgi:cytochrome c oxidase assembly protein subunit 15